MIELWDAVVAFFRVYVVDTTKAMRISDIIDIFILCNLIKNLSKRQE